MKEFNFILLGFAIASFLLAAYMGKLLYKKPTTHNEIDKASIRNKRNTNSNIDNDITPSIESKKGALKRLRTKKEKRDEIKKR